MYTATPVPFNATPAELERYLNTEMYRIAQASQIIETDRISLQELNAPPAKPRTGDIVLADGTNWNPGSGAGFYGYRGGSWRFLG